MVAGLCRLLRRAGVRVAPFKAQNMSLNSFVTMEGGEIGRAQALQAQACQIPPHVDMNPILLKPDSDEWCQIIVHGSVLTTSNARDYLNRTRELFPSVRESYERLAHDYDVIVIEGAGSAAEVNLRDRDIVNWPVVELAGAPVLLVANIDQGGVFAQVVGTLDLLSSEERRRVAGIIINKFRGDVNLFADGVAFLEQRTGVPVLGVVPFIRDLELDQEDCIERDGRNEAPFTDTQLNIAVTLLPRMSNFTDFNALAAESDVVLRYARSPMDLLKADVVIIPGSKNTIDDLAYLRHAGFSEALQLHIDRGGQVVGICGGYQMLGRRISAPHGIEPGASVAGFGFLDVTTELMSNKITNQTEARCLFQGATNNIVVSGYQIHMGRTERHSGAPCFELLMGRNRDDDDQQRPIAEDGSMSREGLIWGTYIHGLFDGPTFRRLWLNELRHKKGLPPLDLSESVQTTERLQRQLDRWADHVRQHIDCTVITRALGIASFK